MIALQSPIMAQPQAAEMVRLSKSKQAVDASPNTVRKFFKQGLPAYRVGKTIWFSRTQFNHFIMTRSMTRNHHQPAEVA